MYTEFSVAAVSSSSLLPSFRSSSGFTVYILIKSSLPSYDRISSIRPICTTRIIDLLLPNIASNRVPNAIPYIYTLARLRFVYFVCQNFNLSRYHKKKEKSFLVYAVGGQGTIRGGCVRCVCVREYVCQGEKDFSQQRERRTVEEEEEVLLACT